MMQLIGVPRVSSEERQKPLTSQLTSMETSTQGHEPDEILQDHRLTAIAIPTASTFAELTDSARPVSADVAYVASPEVTRELFEKAVAVHSRRLLAIARAIVGYRASPEDVVQQAVMNLFRHRDRYDWREPGGLLKRAVVNESLRLLRPPKMTLVSDDQPDSTDTPVDGLIENETVKQVRDAIAKLPDHFRAALVLCEYEQMSYVDIAKTLDASVPQVKTWLHRARRQLAKMLAGYVDQERSVKKV